MTSTLIVGFGYLGREVAKQMTGTASTADSIIYATTRTPEKFDAIRSLGCQPLKLDWNDTRTLQNLPGVDQVLISVAYDSSSGFDRETSMVSGLEQLLGRITQVCGDSKPTRITYISTTGVYHQTDGQWVDETSTTMPSRAGGRAHLRAEAKLAAWARRRQSTQATTLRLSGIYGRGRIPRAAHVREGRPIASPETGYLNLIHVRDAAKAVQASWWSDSSNAPKSSSAPKNASTVYCVSDDQPVCRRSFYEHIARCYDAPAPTFVQPDVNSSARFRSMSNKRIWNRKMRRHLLCHLEFPNYKAGLADALDLDSAGHR